ncbi:MAG: SPFH domain-containing protein [Candidatus Azobacteroides sp.]|nr:SPFH domain-containing protein [Candidatus Azobacteroides sp.]
MGLFNKNRTDGTTYDGQGEERKGFIDRIKYNGEEDELVWKFPYENLSIGAQLIVNQTQEAVFVKGGAIADIFGAGTHTLSANNIPVLQKLINIPFGGRSPFTAEVWYVSKTIRRNLKFGTPQPIDLLDPLYGVSIPVRSFGEFGVQVTDSSAFLQQMVGTLHLFTTDDIIEQFKSLIVQKLTASISKFVVQKEVTVVKINAYIDEVANYVRDAINEEFAQYGVRIASFNIASLNFDKADPNVQKILDSQSEAAKRRMEGYTYQQERQLDVMETAAGNEGSAGQMMGAGMGLGMGFGVGGAFGQQMGNMAGVMQQQQQATPPPPPTATVWFVLVNNQQYQYDTNTLGQYIQSGQITRDTLVWKNGMAQWAKTSDCPELQGFFGATPPPPPPIV